MTDLEQLLSTIHEELATTLLARLRSGEATAADLNVIRQFLKDNHIDTIPKKGDTVTNIVHELPFTSDLVN